MGNGQGRIERCVMYFSMKERKKREYQRYLKQVHSIRQLSKSELEAEYIDAKCKYEYKKNIFSLLLISVLLGILVDVWEMFSKFIEQLIKFSTMYQGNVVEATKIGFLIGFIVAVGVTAVLFVVLFIYARKMHFLYKHLLLLEEERKN